MCDPSASAALVTEVELSGAPPGRTARLILDLGYASDEAAAVARHLARGVLTQIEAMLTDRATALPTELRGALAALASALSEQPDDRATVTLLTRRWRAPGGHIRPGGGGEGIPAGAATRTHGPSAPTTWRRGAGPGRSWRCPPVGCMRSASPA